jgi:predicted metalloprotease
MRRLVGFVFALLLLVAPAQAAGPGFSPTADVLSWSQRELDGYYRVLFALQGQEYVAPRVTIVPPQTMVYTACGSGRGTSLAFYCPADQQIVMSAELVDWLAEKDEFLPAYVLSHEWAHHAQRLSGTVPVYLPKDGDWDQVYTIENELRADCMAGAWMGNIASRGYLNATDMSFVLLTASEIGDPGLYGRGASHGEGVERLRAVFTGYEEGIIACAAITPMGRNQT